MAAKRTKGHPGQMTRLQKIGWMVAALLALILIIQLARQESHPTEFHGYYTAAHLVREGVPVSRLYDNEWFRAEGRRLVPGLNEIYNANLPTTALAYLPFAVINEPMGARIAWIIISVVLLIVLIESLSTIAATGSELKPYWYVVMLVAQPVRANLFLGQAYLVAAVGLVMTLNYWRKGRNCATGITLASLFAYKSVGVFLWPVAAVSKRWGTIFAGLTAFAVVVTLTWPIVGAAGWHEYFREVASVAATAWARATTYQSIEGFSAIYLATNKKMSSAPRCCQRRPGWRAPWH